MKKKLLGLLWIGIFCFSLKANAVQIKISEDTFADLQAQIRVFYLNLDKGGYGFAPTNIMNQYKDYRQHHFQVYKYRLGAKGQIGKLISFYGNLDSNDNEEYQTMLWEGAIYLNFRPEFIIGAGKIRVPFSRHNFVGRHNSPVMSSDGDYFLANQFKEALKPVNPYEGGYRGTQAYKRTDMGMMVKGSIKDGLIKYFVGIFSEDRSENNKVWSLSGGFGKAQTTGIQKSFKNFEYDVRLEFTPTFWGFKQEPNAFDPSSRVYQTYGGTFDTMTFGIGYHHETHLENADITKYGASSLTRKAYAVDFAFEKRFYKKYLIGAELGYIYFKDTHFYEKVTNIYKKGDAWTWYGEAHLIYDEKIGIGYSGIGFRYEYVEVDGNFQNEKNLVYERYGACLSYYPIKGKKGIDVTNRIGIGFDYVKAQDALKAYIKNKNWDPTNFTWYVGIYVNF
uniref:Phosphate-selective porin O and P n=1 Tax=Thermodesulfobacterium geofontis TaxID=1295609 RepID=A0A7V4JP34_9BACT